MNDESQDDLNKVIQEAVNREQAPEYDYVQARKDRCEPIVKAILQGMLDKKLLLSDRVYIQSRVDQVVSALFSGVINEHFNEIFEMLSLTLERHIEKANHNLWGKDLDQLTVDDIQKALDKK